MNFFLKGFKNTHQSYQTSLVLIGFLLICVISFVFYKEHLSTKLFFLNTASNSETITVIKNNDDCTKQIDLIDNATEAFSWGEGYFGGQRGYNLECARYAYNRAINLDMTVNNRVWYQFGRTDFLMGNFNAALNKFDKQVEFFGEELPNVYYMIGLTNGYNARKEGNKEDWQKAEEAFRHYIELDPVSPWARTDLSWIYFAQGKYEEMKPVLEKGLETHFTHPWLLNMYGLALLNTNERQKAHEHFVLALQEANKLTREDWGNAYPGNNPNSLAEGLAEMKSSIQKNIEISEGGP